MVAWGWCEGGGVRFMAPGGGVMVLHAPGGGTMFSKPFVSCCNLARLQLELALGTLGPFDPGMLICVGVAVGVGVGTGV